MDNDVDQVLTELKRSSRVSLLMILVGTVFLLGSVLYSVTRLRPLQEEIATNQRQLEHLKQQQEGLLDFIMQVADQKQVSILDPDVDWVSVRRDLIELRAGDRKKSLLIAILLAWKEIPFTLGGQAPQAGFDSPRFLRYVLSRAGVEIDTSPGERLSDAMMRTFVKTETPKPGDLVFYRGQIGSFGLIYLSNGRDGKNPAGIGTLQAAAPLRIMSLENVNTRNFPLIGYFRVIYPDERN